MPVSAFTAEFDRRFRIVVGGVSLGGVEAMRALLAGLPPDFPLPVAFVQHRGEEPDDTLSPLLRRDAALRVKEAEDKEPILPGYFYLAPRGYHLMVDGDRFALSVDAPVRNARPSIDVLFESAADAYGPGTIGVVLTGASADGAAGAARRLGRGADAIDGPGRPDAAGRHRRRQAGTHHAAGADRAFPVPSLRPSKNNLWCRRLACLGSRDGCTTRRQRIEPAPCNLTNN
jgi:two-component system chemotaxis response regulator CheB